MLGPQLHQLLPDLLEIVEDRPIFELELSDHRFQLAEEGKLREVHRKLMALKGQIEGLGLQFCEVVLEQHAMQSSLAGQQIAVPVVVGQLLGKHPFFVHPAAPVQVEGPRVLVLVLQPASVEQHSLQPNILRVKDEDLVNSLNAQSPPVLRNQVVESLALAIDDKIHIRASLLIPFLLIPSSLYLIAHLTLVLHEVIWLELRGDDVCALVEHGSLLKADAGDWRVLGCFLGGQRGEL